MQDKSPYTLAFVNPRNGLVSQKNLFFQADSRLVKLKVRINRMNQTLFFCFIAKHWVKYTVACDV